MYGQKLIINYF